MPRIKNQKVELEPSEWFEKEFDRAAFQRRREKRRELRAIASRLRQMFRTLSDELVLSRERSLALVAEYGGMLPKLAGDLNRVREGELGYGLDPLAEKLEQGVSFLIGFFAAHKPDRRTWRLDRTEIKASLQKVWPTVRRIEEIVSRRDGPSDESIEEDLPEAA